ncbi:MAG: hypothetical protein KIS79_09905, partial [Burkholderiales bacterium]|nr:hypothetical protein [Burkholderiales bacterium]
IAHLKTPATDVHSGSGDTSPCQGGSDRSQAGTAPRLSPHQRDSSLHHEKNTPSLPQDVAMRRVAAGSAGRRQGIFHVLGLPAVPRGVSSPGGSVDCSPVVAAAVQETMMKVLRVLDSTGDRVIEFDDSDATLTAQREAKALFERMLTSGSVAFKVNRGEGRPDEKVADFDALENETVIVPRVVGG